MSPYCLIRLKRSSSAAATNWPSRTMAAEASCPKQFSPRMSTENSDDSVSLLHARTHENPLHDRRVHDPGVRQLWRRLRRSAASILCSRELLRPGILRRWIEDFLRFVRARGTFGEKRVPASA